MNPLDPWRAAKLLIDEHDERAATMALKRRRELREAGDEAGAAALDRDPRRRNGSLWRPDAGEQARRLASEAERVDETLSDLRLLVAAAGSGLLFPELPAPFRDQPRRNAASGLAR